MDCLIKVPEPRKLTKNDISGVRWLEAAFIEANYTVEYAKYLQHYRVVRALVMHAKKKEQATIVDLGCNNGIKLFALHKALNNQNIRYIGVDLDAHALQQAANRISYREFGNIELHLTDVTQTMLPAESADIVYSSEVIEHLRKPHLLFSEIYRLLKPGGTALITTPNPSNYFRRVAYILNSISKGALQKIAYSGMTEKLSENSGFTVKDDLLGHVSVNSPRYWKNLAKQIGFKVKIERASTMIYGYPWLARHPSLFLLICLADRFLQLMNRWYNTSWDLIIHLQKE